MSPLLDGEGFSSEQSVGSISSTLSIDRYRLEGLCSLSMYEVANKAIAARAAYFEVLQRGGEKETWNETHTAPLVARSETGAGREVGFISVVAIAVLAGALSLVV